MTIMTTTTTRTIRTVDPTAINTIISTTTTTFKEWSCFVNKIKGGSYFFN